MNTKIVSILAAAIAVPVLGMAAAESRDVTSGAKVVQRAVIMQDQAGTVTTVTEGLDDAKDAIETCGGNAVVARSADGYITCQTVKPVQEEAGALEADAGLSENVSLLAATYEINIPAISCAPFGAQPFETCFGGGTVRTDGDEKFPCAINGFSERDTYICPLVLPAGAAIQEIIAFGMDFDPVGYFEAAVWRTANTTFAPTYFSSFGGKWRSSGKGFDGGPTSFSIFKATTPPHSILPNSRYTIGFATKAPSGAIIMHGFRVRYAL
jgi:hypothetical protein